MGRFMTLISRLHAKAAVTGEATSEGYAVVLRIYGHPGSAH